MHGEQPSERIRHITRCGRSPSCSGTNGCSRQEQRVPADDDLALPREVERHDRDVLLVDVLPDVELGPVRQREDADALARVEPAVEVVPQLRPLPLWDPTGPAGRAARTLAPWPAIAPRRGERRRTRRRSLPSCSASSSARVLSSPQQRCVPTANGWVPSAIAASFVCTISRAPTWCGVPVAELDHLAELVGRVDVQQRERNRPGIERLLRQPQQHRRVLADRVEHHRPLELGRPPPG